MKITEERLKELERAESKLNALEAGGVDNWEWYGDSLEKYHVEIKLESEIDDLFDELLEILFTGSYEPSEHGAGFTCGDDERKEASHFFHKNIKTLLSNSSDGSNDT